MTNHLFRPSRFTRWSAAAAAACLTVLPFSAPVGAQESSGSGHLDQLGSCIASQHKLDVVLLMDETESLIHEVSGGQIHKDKPGTDPDDVRVPAAEGFVQQLLDRQKDMGFTTSIRVAGFGQNYNPQPGDDGVYGGWTELTDSTVGSINNIIAGAADRDSELYTNYANAFTGSYQDFPRSGQPDSCKLLVTFTDGALTAEGPASANTEAEERICKPGGIADTLRQADIYHVGIGLSQPGVPSDFSLFEGITSGGGKQCGDTPANGAFFPADSVGSLFASFRQALGAAGTHTGETTAKQAFTFVLDNSIDSVRFTAIARDDLGEAAHPVLVGPNGKELALSDESTGEVDGAEVSWQAESTPVQQVSGVMKLKEGASWEGPWNLKFVDYAEGADDKRVFNSVRIQPDMRVNIVSTANDSGDGGIQMRDSDQIQVSLVGRDNQIHSMAGKALLTANYIPADGGTPVVLTKDADLSNGGPVALPLDNIRSYPANGTLETSVTVTTKGSGELPGTTLEAVSTSRKVSISQENMPSVPSDASFTMDSNETTVEIPVTGPGKVWVENGKLATTAAPEGLGEVSVSSEYNSADNALTVERGATAALPVTLSVNDLTDGVIAGSFPVKAASDDGADTADYQVGLNGNASKPLNKTTFTLVFILLLLLGILIPLLILYLIRFISAHLPKDGVYQIKFTGTYDPAHNTLEFPKGSADREISEQTPSPVNTGSSGFTAGAASCEIVKFIPNPMAMPFVRIKEPLAASIYGRSKQLAKLPLAVHNTWFVVRSATDPTKFTVVVLTPLPFLAENAKTIASQITNETPKLVDELAKLHPAADTPSSSAAPAAAGGGNDAWGNASSGNDSWGSGSSSGNDTWGSGGSGGSSSGNDSWGSGSSSGNDSWGSGSSSGNDTWGSGGSGGSSSGSGSWGRPS